MLLGQGLRLLLREAALRQALDEPVGVEGDGLAHVQIIGIPPGLDKKDLGPYEPPTGPGARHNRTVHVA